MGQQGPPGQGSSYFTYSSAEQILRHTASNAKTWKGTPPLLESQDSIIYLVIPPTPFLDKLTQHKITYKFSLFNFPYLCSGLKSITLLKVTIYISTVDLHVCTHTNPQTLWSTNEWVWGSKWCEETRASAGGTGVWLSASAEFTFICQSKLSERRIWSRSASDPSAHWFSSAKSLRQLKYTLLEADYCWRQMRKKTV